MCSDSWRRGIGGYFDHHHAGEVPQHPSFEPHIKEAADVCTTLVDHHQPADIAWAIVAAFGDNLPELGNAAGRPASMHR
jgi:hypothetical protein